MDAMQIPSVGMARSLKCFRAVRDFVISMTSMVKCQGISKAAVSNSVRWIFGYR